MKVLILTLSTGAGHHAAGAAVAAALQERGHTARVDDAYRIVSAPLHFVVDRTYRLCAGPWRHAYGIGYRMREKGRGMPGLSRTFNAAHAGRLWRYIQDYKPDAIVYTHVFAGMLLDALRRQGRLTFPVVGIVTDYTLHPGWERLRELGELILPCEALRHTAEACGFPAERLHVFGIPVREEFQTLPGVKAARRKMGFREKEPLVMVMGGSMGFGAPQKLVRELDRADIPFRLTVLCGTNLRAYNKLLRMKTKHPLAPVAFTKNVPLYMAGADVLITKPGGLSTSEALAAGLPMLLHRPIPGHEAYNEAYLLQSGAALPLDAQGDKAAFLKSLLQDEGRLQSMRAAARAAGHPDSATKLAEYVEKCTLLFAKREQAAANSGSAITGETTKEGGQA